MPSRASDNLIFSTPHGSVLYGLDHAGSDRDMMYVYDTDQRARQRIDGNEDYVTVGLSRFLELAESGAHQYLEALFSPVKEWHNAAYQPMIESMVMPAGQVRAKYMRTIKHFAYGPTLKRRRHSLRLGLAMRDMTLHGRFNPRLDELTADTITNLAQQLKPDDLYGVAKGLAVDFSEQEWMNA